MMSHLTSPLLKIYIYLFNVSMCLCFCARVGTLYHGMSMQVRGPGKELFVSFHQMGLGPFLPFFVVSLTLSGMNYNQEMESTPVRNFLLGLQWVNLFLF